jgi:hypothetical protein
LSYQPWRRAIRLRATRPAAARPNSAKPAGAGTGVPPVELEVLLEVEELVDELVLELLLEGPQLLGRQALAGAAMDRAATARVPEAASFRIRVFMSFLLPSRSDYPDRSAEAQDCRLPPIRER